MDKFKDLPVIKLPRLEANDPTQLNDIQRMLWPHLPAIETGWWILWWAILLYLTGKYVLLPLLSRRRG